MSELNKKLNKLLDIYTQNELASILGLTQWQFLSKMDKIDGKGFTDEEIKVINSLKQNSMFKESFFTVERDNIQLYCHSTWFQIFGKCFFVKTIYSTQKIFPLLADR